MPCSLPSPFCPVCPSLSSEQEAPWPPLPCCQCQLSDKRGPCVQTWDRGQRRSLGGGGPSSDTPATAGHSPLFNMFNPFLPTGSIHAGGSAWPFKGQCIAFLPQQLPQTSSSADGSSLFPPISSLSCTSVGILLNSRSLFGLCQARNRSSWEELLCAMPSHNSSPAQGPILGNVR